MKLYDIQYVRWSYEDELPEDLTTSDYNAMYPFSRVQQGGITGVKQFRT